MFFQDWRKIKNDRCTIYSIIEMGQIATLDKKKIIKSVAICPISIILSLFKRGNLPHFRICNMEKHEIIAGIKEAAKVCDISARTVRNRLEKHTFPEPCLKSSHIYIWHREDLLAWKLNKLEKKLIKKGVLRKQE